MLYLINYKIINHIFDVTEMNHIVEGKNFEEAKAYVEGYAEAVNHFKSIFENSEKSLIEVLDDILPSHN